MATAPYAGINGSVATGTGNGTKIANIKNWSLKIGVDINDTTAFGDTNTSAVQGLRNATADISGDLSTDATEKTLIGQVSNAGTLAALTLNLIISTIAGKKAKWLATGALLSNLQS